MTPQEAVDGKFYQTSRKYRHIARLAPGVDPLEYIKKVDPVWFRHLRWTVESYILRCGGAECVERYVFDTREEMDEFRKLGGGAA